MHRNIWLLGLVSLVTDISSEMVYPLVPIYLTAVLGASPAVLGLIEGIAESLASLLKVYAGRISDRLERRKSLAIAGYGVSAIGKLLFVLATSWVGILGARVADRFGKGIRTAPRDAIIAESTQVSGRGTAFGLHRAMDTAGAVIGILLAYWLVIYYHENYVTVFWLAVIPAAIGVGLLFFITETGGGKTAKKISFAWSQLDCRLRFFLIVTFLFNLGNSSNQFLLVRAGAAGFSAEQVILLYLLMNVSYFVIAYPAGRLSDKIGRRGILVTGYALYGLVYLGFAMVQSTWQMIGLFMVYGFYIGLTEGVEKALLADVAPADQRATIYGLHAMTVGLALLPASVLAGVLWEFFGATVPFWFGGLTGLLSAAALWLGLRQPKES